jgi:hypothetical protein
MRPTVTLLTLALACWLASIAAAGAAAMAAFASLPKMGISVSGVEAFFSGNTGEMGRYAAGRMLAPVFTASDWVQFTMAAASVSCTVRLVRTGALRGWRPMRVTFIACVAVAAAMLAWRAWSAPTMNAELLTYWNAVEAQDASAAADARARFDGMHRAADTVFRASLFLVLGAIASLPGALLPAPSPMPNGR